METSGETTEVQLVASKRSPSVGSVPGAAWPSLSPSPTPSVSNIHFDSELQNAELPDEHFQGVTVGVCAMSKKVRMVAAHSRRLHELRTSSFVCKI